MTRRGARSIATAWALACWLLLAALVAGCATPLLRASTTETEEYTVVVTETAEGAAALCAAAGVPNAVACWLGGRFTMILPPDAETRRDHTGLFTLAEHERCHAEGWASHHPLPPPAACRTEARRVLR